MAKDSTVAPKERVNIIYKTEVGEPRRRSSSRSTSW